METKKKLPILGGICAVAAIVIAIIVGVVVFNKKDDVTTANPNETGTEQTSGGNQSGSVTDEDASTSADNDGSTSTDTDAVGTETGTETTESEEEEPEEDIIVGTVLFEGGENEAFETEDPSWLLDAKDTDVITLVYTCADATHNGWGVLAWGATVDGEWVEGPEFFAGVEDATAKMYSTFTVAELKKALGITEDSEVGTVKLGAWNGGQIISLSIGDKASTIVDAEKVIMEGSEGGSEVEELEANETAEGLSGTYIKVFEAPGKYEVNIASQCPGFVKGDTISVTVVLEGDGGFTGGIGTSTGSNYAWTQQDYATEEAGTVTWTFSAKPTGDIVEVGIFSISGSAVGIKSISMNVTAKGEASSGFEGAIFTATSKNTDFEIKPSTYCSSFKEGDTIQVSVSLYSDMTYNGCVGGSTAEGSGWVQTESGDKTGASTWTVTVPAAYDYVKIGIWWVEPGSKVAVKSISVSVVGSDSGSSTGGYETGAKIEFNAASYCPDFEPGDTIKVTANLSSDDYFKFNMGGSDQDGGWNQDPAVECNGGSKSHTMTIANAAGGLQIYIEWANTSVSLDSVTVTIVSKGEGNGSTASGYETHDKVEMNAASYAAGFEPGDTIKITVSLTSDDYYKFTIGGSGQDGTWNQTSAFEITSGATTQSYTIADAAGYFQVYFEWVNTAVTLNSVTVEVVAKGTGSEATPEPEATATPDPSATATPEPTATATPDPSATATPEPTATATPTPEDSDAIFSGNVESGNWTTYLTIPASKFAGVAFDGTQKLVITYTTEAGKNWAQYKLAVTDPYTELTEVCDMAVSTIEMTEDVVLTADLADIATGGLMIQGANWIITKVEVTEVGPAPTPTPVPIETITEAGNFTINIADYCSDFEVGDSIEVNVLISSDAMFNGVIGTDVAGEWTTTAKQENSAGMWTWTAEFDNVTSDTLLVQVWYMKPGATYVSIHDVEITVPGSEPEATATPEPEATATPEPEATATPAPSDAPEALYTFTTKNEGYTFNLQDWIADIAKGDTVKITAVVEGEGTFNGGICGNVLDEEAAQGYAWATIAEYNNNSTTAVGTMVAAFDGEWNTPEVQIWNLESDVKLVSLNVEKVTAPAEPTPTPTPAPAVLYTFTAKNEGYSFNLQDWIADIAKGETVRITAVVEGEGTFNGGICGNVLDEEAAQGYAWATIAEYNNNSTTAVGTMVAAFDGEWNTPEVQIWNLENDVKLVSLVVERIN